MTECLIFYCIGIGIMVGGILAFLRGQGNNNTIISFIFGVLLGGTSSPFLNIQNSEQFIFQMQILGSIAMGVVIGIIAVAAFMEWIYTDIPPLPSY